ncbi:peptidylprolyl isomerase, partial [Acidiphilium sp.]|uniref:peptidylprolyl isomerase n=1 Tax=Acidiphilium sp. TaxID=527 RepID=UPI003D00C1E8
MQIKQTIRRVALGTLASLGLLAGAFAQNLVRVNGHALTLAQLLATAPQALDDPRARAEALQQLVREQLLAGTVGMPPESVQSQIDAGQADVRRRLLAQFAVERYLSAHPVSQAKVDEVMHHVLAAAPTEEYWVRSIVVSTPKQSLAMLAQLRHGASFARLAIAHSQADNAASGGALGWRDDLSLPAPYLALLHGLRVGEVTGPIAIDQGYAIIELLGR